MSVRELSSIGIVGAGTMGARIAYQCVLCKKQVYLFDNLPQALERAVGENRKWLGDRVDPETAKAAIARLHPCASLADCLADVELVIETVPENLELKRRVFAEIDRLAPACVLIATNSSSLPSSRLADATTRPDKVFNVNFNDPLEDETLVELMGHAATSEETMAVAERFLRSVGLVPIIAKREIMGFAFNRVWRAIKREVLHLVGDGIADFEDIDRAWILSFGSHRGPFGRMDEIGLDVIRDIEMQYYLDSGESRDKPPRFLDEMIAQGRLGVKSGRGFYTYPDPECKRPGWLRKEAPWTREQTIKLELV